jgi:hypothetical protein
MQEPRGEESSLGPEDFDHALRRMKTDLALLGLRRELLRQDLDARRVLALADQIVAIQTHGLA